MTSEASVLSRISWTTVSRRLPCRSAKDCRKRLVYSLDVSLRKGPWTKTEDQRLVEEMAKLSNLGHRDDSKISWTALGRAIGTRSGDQVSKRWRGVLQPALERSAHNLSSIAPAKPPQQQQQHSLTLESEGRFTESTVSDCAKVCGGNKNAGVKAYVSGQGPKGLDACNQTSSVFDEKCRITREGRKERAACAKGLKTSSNEFKGTSSAASVEVGVDSFNTVTAASCESLPCLLESAHRTIVEPRSAGQCVYDRTATLSLFSSTPCSSSDSFSSSSEASLGSAPVGSWNIGPLNFTEPSGAPINISAAPTTTSALHEQDIQVPYGIAFGVSLPWMPALAERPFFASSTQLGPPAPVSTVGQLSGNEGKDRSCCKR